MEGWSEWERGSEEQVMERDEEVDERERAHLTLCSMKTINSTFL